MNASTLQINTEGGSLAGVTPAAVIDVIPNVSNNPFQYAQLQNGIIPEAPPRAPQPRQGRLESARVAAALSLPANGQIVGLSQGGDYGTWNLGTFDPVRSSWLVESFSNSGSGSV